MNHKSYSLTIGWLYPELMSTYGDRGNIIVLTKRCEWRDIDIKILPISPEMAIEDINTVDLIFGGGAQDRQQAIVMKDLKGKKGSLIKEKIEQNIPALFVCGSPQLMGNYYEPAKGQRIEGLAIFDMESIHPGPDKPRLIGNVIAEIDASFFDTKYTTIIGFENHGGRTYLGKGVKPFATVVQGNGNNGEDGTEGVIYKNAIGCYFHGPLLPKNPHIADWLIKKALEIKYKENIQLKELDDQLEWEAHKAIAKRLGLSI